MVVFDINEPPIAWKRPGFRLFGKFGHVYDQQEKEKRFTRCLISSGFSMDVIDGPVAIDVVFFMPIPKSASKKTKNKMACNLIYHTKKPDLDNLLKYLFDSMTGIVFKDDAQIYSICAKKRYSDFPRTMVGVTQVDIDKESNSVGERKQEPYIFLGH